MLRPATGRLAGIVIALTLFAAACGTDSATVETATAAADTDSATETNDSENSAAAPDDAPDEASDDSADAAAGSDTSDEPAAEAQEPEPVGDHEFPDLGTVNIADGAAINLADQLAGGDTPVLLWFFAPH